MVISWFKLLERARPAACVAALLLATSSFAGQKPDAAKAKPTAATTAATDTDDGKPMPVDPNVVDDLKKMGAYLHGLQEFNVHADTTLEEVIGAGHKIQYGGMVDYAVRKPDRLRVTINTDRFQRELYFDGKTATLYAPLRKYYATFDAPPTIHELVERLDAEYHLELPIADLFTWGGPKDHSGLLTSAVFIGEATINGTKCNHYAFRQPDVDWQLWIAGGDKPLPCKIAITTTSEPEQPGFTSVFRWDTAAKIDDKDFAFAVPTGVTKIGIVRSDSDAK